MTDTKKSSPIARLEALGMSRYYISKRLGVAHSTVRGWARGWHEPSVENMAKLERLEQEGRGRE